MTLSDDTIKQARLWYAEKYAELPAGKRPAEARAFVKAVELAERKKAEEVAAL